jgi:hypothetical protein
MAPEKSVKWPRCSRSGRFIASNKKQKTIAGAHLQDNSSDEFRSSSKCEYVVAGEDFSRPTSKILWTANYMTPLRAFAEGTESIDCLKKIERQEQVRQTWTEDGGTDGSGMDFPVDLCQYAYFGYRFHDQFAWFG